MRAHRTPWLLAALIVVLTVPALAETKCTEIRTGINLPSPAFGSNIPGREGFDYRFPTSSQIEYFSKVGFDSIRLAIKWERLQPELHGSLDQKYLAGIISVLDSAAENRVDVLIDIHNYARYRKELIGSDAVPASAFFDVWQRLARAVSSHKALYAYGLMNEPFNTKGLWHQVAQSGVDGIRSVDRTHRIYVAGDRFSSTAHWPKINPTPFVRDPVNLEVYEGHIYLDVDFSGKYHSVDPPKDPATLVNERMQPFIDWLSTHGKKGAVGEWGVPSDDGRWFSGVNRMIEISRANCLPTYVWAGGSWSPGYKLSLQPVGDTERLLTKHFSVILGRDKK
jgi:endoglucanase